MLMFLSRLAQLLSTEGDNWRKDTLFLLDGASYHKSEEVRAHLRNLGIDVILSAPYSYEAAPCELFFAYFKQENLNPDNIKTGKR